MGRAFEYRKARKIKRWGNMSRTFTRIGKEITIAVKAGGPDPTTNPRRRALMQNAKAENMPKETTARSPCGSDFGIAVQACTTRHAAASASIPSCGCAP